MKLLAFLLAFVNLQGQQAPTPPADPNLLAYQNLMLGLKFNYPKTWELTTNKKSESRILIPIESTSERAVVEIFPVSFRKEPEIWQLSQVGMNKTMKRDVERQWDEEILGVPLLLTKVNYSDNGIQKTSETGLIYSLGFNKMMYRITTSPSDFDKVDYEWRQVLQTLRTWDGSMPKPEDPTLKIERKEVPPSGGFKPDEIPHPTIPHPVNARTKVKLVVAPVAATVELGGEKIMLHVPADWKVDANKDGSFTFRTPGVSGPVSGTLYPADGSDPPDIALRKASGISLNDFVSVNDREEILPRSNRAGAPIALVWRFGAAAKGQLVTTDAYCRCEAYYLMLSYRTDNVDKGKAEVREIEALVDRMSIEPAP